MRTPLGTERIEGKWWLPGKGRTRMPGTLELDEFGGGTLELIIPKRYRPGFGYFQYKLIFGTCVKSGNKIRITLIDPITSQTINDHVIVLINEIIVGAHVRTLTRKTIHSVRFNLTNLQDWLRIDGIKYRADLASNKIVAKFAPTKTRLIRISPEAQIQFSTRYKGSFVLISFNTKSLEFGQQNQVEIFFDKPVGFRHCLAQAEILRSLVSLGLRLRPSFLEFSMKMNEKGKNIDCIYARPQIDKKLDDKNIDVDNILFTYRKLASRPANGLRNWWRNMETLTPVLEFYLTNLDRDRLVRRVQFLNYMQALESYHRRRFGGYYQRKGKYQISTEPSLLKAIPPGISGDHKQSLSQRIKFGNEYSLRKRLHELYKKHEEILSEVFRNGKKDINDLVSLRNSLTHYPQGVPIVDTESTKFLVLVRKLQLFLEVCLYSEVGIREKTMIRRFETLFDYQCAKGD